MSTLKRHATEHTKNTEHRDDCTWLSYLLSRDVISSFHYPHNVWCRCKFLILVHVKPPIWCLVFVQVTRSVFGRQVFRKRLKWAWVVGGLCASLRGRNTMLTAHDARQHVLFMDARARSAACRKRNIYLRVTSLRTNLSPPKALLRMMFLFPRWDTWFPGGYSFLEELRIERIAD